MVARAAEDRIRRLHNLAGLLVFADSVMVRDVLANQDDVDRTLRARSALRSLRSRRRSLNRSTTSVVPHFSLKDADVFTQFWTSTRVASGRFPARITEAIRRCSSMLCNDSSTPAK